MITMIISYYNKLRCMSPCTVAKLTHCVHVVFEVYCFKLLLVNIFTLYPICWLDTERGSNDSTVEPTSFRPPRITLAPEDNVTVPTAQSHRLTMLVRYDRGFPLSTFVWRKDGEIITSRNNPRMSVMSNGGISIRSVKSSDRGLYTITVSNTAGSDSASFKLFTECKC